ncbi:MAG: nitroreductase family protein [Promethearchaeota archaeon]
MEIQVDSWYKAIEERHSQRAFNGKSLSEEQLLHLENICREFRPFRGGRAVVVRTPPENVFTGAIGSYGKIRDSPHIIAFIGDTRVPEINEVVGYLGEGVILEATSMDVHTCWVGGFFRPEIVRRHLELDDNEKVFAITPIGHGLERKTGSEKVFSRILRSRKRKQTKDLLLGTSDFSTDWIETALEAARLAPSAANRQPWRFVVDSDSITIRMDNLRNGRWVSKRLDCGIAMLHLELGAGRRGVKGTWEFLPTPDVVRFHADSRGK